MKCAKIVVKNNYEKKGDLVLRSYIRALRKVSADLLLDGDNAIIYGKVLDDGRFYELFTNMIIDSDYTLVSLDEANSFYDAFMDLSKEDVITIKSIIEKIIFDKNIELDFEVSSMEDLAKDRAIEFEAYDNYMSSINPYQRLNNDSDIDYNAYNDFPCKVKEIRKMKEKNKRYIQEYNYDVTENLNRK